MVLGGRPQFPQHGVARAREEHAAGALVSRPLANVRARDVADVVLIEQQDRAEVRRSQCGTCPLEPIAPESREIHTLLPVHPHRGTTRSDQLRLLVGACSATVNASSGLVKPSTTMAYVLT